MSKRQRTPPSKAGSALVASSKIPGAKKLAAAAKAPQRLSDSLAAAKAFFAILRASAMDKQKRIAAFLQDAPKRLAQVAVRHGVKQIGALFGFADIAALVRGFAARLTEMEARDRTLAEFMAGAAGRRNTFLGYLFELTVKYGPFRAHVEALSRDALRVLNDEIRKRPIYAMANASGSLKRVAEPFTFARMAPRFDIDAGKGPRAALDFGMVAFNSAGQWTLPLPVEIKLPRAAGGVAAQFAEFTERVAAAAKVGRPIFAFFDEEHEQPLASRLGKSAITSAGEIDGRPMIKVALDPAKLVFHRGETVGVMRRNQMVLRPDGRLWNPARPTALPLGSPVPDFEVGRVGGRPVTVDIAATDKGDGFTFWRVNVPIERALLVDVDDSLRGG